MAADGFQSGAFQHTVSTPALFSGVGVHTGAYTQVAVRPAPADAGISFIRTDITDRDNRVVAAPESVVKTQLGTVIGMVEIFGSQSPTGGNPAVLAHGISVALYNTALGLIVAIPSMIFFRFFRGRVDALLVEMEQQAIKLVEIVHGDRK